MDPAQARQLDELFGQAEFDRRLFRLRAQHPQLAYELDELARTFRRARDRVTALIQPDERAPAADGPTSTASAAPPG